MTSAQAAGGAGVVLVVEDEPMIGRILEHKLRREGWAVRLAGGIAAAAQVLDAEAVVVAIVDATLESDGLAWASGLDRGRRPACGWLGMVEARDPAAADRARTLGAAGVVVKPFKPTVVAEQVRLLAAAGVGG